MTTCMRYNGGGSGALYGKYGAFCGQNGKFDDVII